MFVLFSFFAPSFLSSLFSFSLSSISLVSRDRNDDLFSCSSFSHCLCHFLLLLLPYGFSTFLLFFFLLLFVCILLIFWFSLLYASRVLFPRFVAVHGRPSDVYVCGRRGWAAEHPSISDISVQSVVGKFRDRICSRPVVYRPCVFCGCLSTKAWPYLGHHLAVSRPSLSRCSAISRSSLWRVS